MNYMRIKKTDIANGPGVRISLFVSGCTHHCKGCFNPETWDFDAGEPFTEDTINEILGLLTPSYISGLSILGGDPLEIENVEPVTHLANAVRDKFPWKSIWCYTGSQFEDIYKQTRYRELLKYIDVIVDGEFQEALKNPELRFRGSSNQRIINVTKSLSQKEVVLWEDQWGGQ